MPGLPPGHRMVRVRVPADWCLDAVTAAETTSFGLTGAQSVFLDPDNPRA
jgi:hypothetical protein